MTLLTRADPGQRMQDYLEALRFYLSVPNRHFDRIVFVENSGSDLAPLRELAGGAGKRVEFVSFDGLDYPPAYGKAYGEFKLIDHGLEHAALLADFGPSDVLWKVTGRYQVRNIGRLIATAPAGYALYGDFRLRAHKWFDLRVFSVSRAGYDRFFRGRYPELREGLPGEDRPSAEAAVVEMLWPRRAEGIVPLFRVEPRVEGVAAYWNVSYTGGARTARFLVRSVLRRVCPGWWFHGRRPWPGSP
jgi:hypothetical protein